MEVPLAVWNLLIVVCSGFNTTGDDSGLGQQGLPRQQQALEGLDEGKIGWESPGDSGTHPAHPHLSTFPSPVEDTILACPSYEI